MKKFIKIMAMLAIVACVVSCSKDETTAKKEEPAAPKHAVALTASFEQPSKVTYSENDDGGLHPAWELGDVVVGVDVDGNPFTLTVISIDETTGKAVLSSGEQTVEDGLVHLIYKKGATASDWISGGMTVNYDKQKINDEMPAVMLSDVTLEGGKGECKFRNAGAVIGVIKANNVPAGSVITRVAVYGKDMSSATIAVSGNSLALTPATKDDDRIASIELPTSGEGAVVVNDDQSLSQAIRIAVPAGAVVKKLSVTTDKLETFYVTSGKTVEAKKYLTIKSSAFEKSIGLFSVSPTKKVAFAPGNMYCTKNSDNTYSFAFEANQYDYRTTYLKDLPGGSTSTDICPCVINGVYSEKMTGDLQKTSGLFQWVGKKGTSAGLGEAKKSYGAFSKLTSDVLKGDVSDKINYADAINNGALWRTLSSAEWEYLINRNSTGEVEKSTVLVYFQTKDMKKPIYGVLIYHDGYTGTFASKGDYIEAIPEGCTFIPAAGHRAPSKEDYSSVGSIVYLWMDTAASTTDANCTAILMGQSLYCFQQGRDYAKAVRLVVDVYDSE